MNNKYDLWHVGIKSFEALRGEYKSLCDELKELRDWINSRDRSERERAALIEAARIDKEKANQLASELRAAEKEKSKRYNILSVAKAYLIDNMKHAYFKETMPKVLEVMNKYSGKIMGEKTREKMREELREKAGVIAWIDCPYKYCSDELNISPADCQYFFAPRGLKILVSQTESNEKRPMIGGEGGNRLQVYNLEDYYIADCGRYVDNYIWGADMAIYKYNELKKRLKDLDDDCRKFNETLPAGIDHVQSYSWRMNNDLA
ncbi:MAG: hypothetical protein J6S14_11940 [Clostridia bacterium]|nr:hypothetical protein [Clostridia bacterium]